jgi:hypothetical protein
MRLITIFIISVLCFIGSRKPEKIRLERIVFHTSRCFGSCPAYHSQIDSNKTFHLFAEYVSNTPDIATNLFNPDSSKMGYFTGRVSDTRYTELESELQIIGLDNLQFDGVDCCDGSIKTIIIYYNGKRKALRSMRPPREADKLISLLRYITESTSTHRTNQKFEIEKE